MKDAALFVTFITILFISIIGGCAVDECVTCPPENDNSQEHVGIIIGEATLNFCCDELVFSAKIYPFEWPIFDVDSILVNGGTANVSLNYIYQNYSVSYGPPLDTCVYSPGDTIEIKIFAVNSISIARVKVLSTRSDMPSIIGWSVESMCEPGTQDANFVHPDSNISVAWHPEENADFYKGYVVISDKSFAIIKRYEFLQTDTIFIIPAPHDESIATAYFRIASATGPLPDDSLGNVSEGVIKGKITSSSHLQSVVFTYMDTVP